MPLSLTLRDPRWWWGLIPGVILCRLELPVHFSERRAGSEAGSGGSNAVKRFAPLLVLVALGAAPAAPPLAPAQLTAVTLNLWHDQHDWPARRTVIVDTLRALQPDVIFLQEVLEKEGLPNQAQQLADSLGYAFRFASVDPVGGPKRYGNAILTRHAITASHDVKLPPLDDWRVAAHARLLLPGGSYLDAYATHLHHTDEGAAIHAEQVAGLLAFVDSTRGGDAALLIGGDFNAEPDRAELAPLFARFTDVLAANADARDLRPGHEHAATKDRLSVQRGGGAHAGSVARHPRRTDGCGRVGFGPLRGVGAVGGANTIRFTRATASTSTAGRSCRYCACFAL